MDHKYIDERSIPGRYLDQVLSPEERAEFEQHLVDCQECMDRLMLAGMFHVRDSLRQEIPVIEAPDSYPEPAPAIVVREWVPERARFIAQFEPWQLVVLFAILVVLLLAIPTAYFLWQLHVARQQ